MKQILRIKRNLAILFFLSFHLCSQAAEPTLSASSITFDSRYVDGGQFLVNFSAGNGIGRIIVVKEGSDIGGKPVDGTTYSMNSNSYDARFGITGSEMAPGEFVVYYGNSTSATITGLKPGTTYYVAIFEYNGTYSTPSTVDYLTLTPTGQKITTLVAPTTQATITGFTLINGNSLRVNIKNGNGTGRIVVARKGSSLTATPTDLVKYDNNSAFKSTTGTSYYLDAESYVVYKVNRQSTGGTDYIDVTKLEPNTTYTFAVFEYNSGIFGYTPVYLKPASVQTITTNAGPTKTATGLYFTKIEGDRMTLNFAYGDGARRIIVARKGAAVTTTPVNGNHYTGNAQFGSGSEMVAGSGEFVVFDGAYTSVTVSNLEQFTTYYFAIYEYDQDSTAYTYYLTSVPPATANHSTALPPTTNTTLSVTSITGSSAQLKYTTPASGYGEYRLLVIKDGGPVDFLPQDLIVYSPGSSTYGSGKLVAPNTYVVVDISNGGAPNITGLTPGHTYYATVFDMNGYTAPVYLRPGSSVMISVPNEPTTAPTNANFTSVEGNSLSFSWVNGDGARRIVVARKGAAVTSVPLDGTTYTAATKFGTGTELSPGNGEFVVYDGTYNSTTVTGLEKGTTYYFSVFEYNTLASSPDYLTTAGKFLNTSKATVYTPTVQVANLSAYNIQSTQASITFAVGNGSSRLFIMHEGAPVDAEPADYTSYFSNSNFGTSITQIGTGNYVVATGSAIFTVANLKPGTQYFITAFEYNGGSAPAYLRPGATMYSFTTTGGVVVSAPTQAATAPAFEFVDGNKLTFKWTNGNGANRIVIARKDNPVTFVPVNGVNYTANASFGTGTDLGSQQYIVYNGNGSNVAVSNLGPASTYYFAEYEYNGSASSIVYGSSALTANHSTAVAPTVKSTAMNITASNGNLLVSWTNGNGDGRLVVMKEGMPVGGTPANLTAYNASSTFQNGSQIAAGEYVVYAGSGTSVTVQGVTAGKTYYFSVFEYNGSSAPMYNTTDVLTGNSTFSSLPLKWLSFTAEEKGKTAWLHWSTALEVNTSYFEVERSSDAINFTTIGSVKNTGRSSTNEYSFSDAAAGGGRIYYRIRQVDIDKQYTYSKTVEVKLAVQEKAVLLQNPATSELRLKCEPELVGGFLLITDASGKLVQKANVTTTFPVINISKQTHGLYYVSIIGKYGEMTSTLPFVH